MKLSKPLLGVVGVLVLVLVLVFGKNYFNKSKTVPTDTTSEYSYSLSPSATDLTVGDKISIPLYINGENASSISAYDIKLYYDSSKLQLTDATPGNFFEKYITVKWEPKSAWFALAVVPGNPLKMADTDSPLMTLNFTAIAKTNETSVSTGTSTIYVSKTGGFHPQSDTVNLTIN
jgi:hypothetical protein